MRVVLINPPLGTPGMSVTPTVVEEGRGHSPPLGILYVAAYLQAHTSHSVTVIDAQVEGLSCDGLGSRTAAIRPDVVGITSTTLTLLDAVRAIDAVRSVCPGATIVMGGPHAHLFPSLASPYPSMR